MCLLLVEDTPDVAEAIVARFSRRGGAVDHASTADEAAAALAIQDYDAAILKISLPSGSGIEVLRALRAAAKSSLVLMLTARSDVDERTSPLDGRAEDYVVKRVDLRELHARIRALARRKQPARVRAIELGDIVFDPARFAFDVHGAPVKLTRRAFSLLEIILANCGRLISKERIFERMSSFHVEEVVVNAVETCRPAAAQA